MEVQIGPEIIRSYKRLAYTAWHALAEFIDNSVQSYLNNRERLDASYSSSGQRLIIQITYSRANGGLLKVRDNAMGMSQEELNAALRIGRPPEDTSGLSEFGMGLKTAACWFGNDWTVLTKKLGSDTLQVIRFDVEQIASGNLDLHYESNAGAIEDHFTEIAISSLNHQLYGRAIQSVKTYLGSMYRTYIRSNELTITFNDDYLTWKSPIDDNVHQEEDGTECLKDFEFSVNEKEVRGWIAIMERGSRANAGLTIIRRGRVIKGWPISWKPQAIFGQPEGTNDLINQRIIGEVHLDEYGVSHTKDDILWEDDEEGLIELKLAEIAKPYTDIALSYRKRGVRGSRPQRSLVDSAMGMLEEEIHSQGFRNVIAANGDTPPEVYEAFAIPMIRAVGSTHARGVYEIGRLKLRLFLSDLSSVRDPFLGVETGADDIVSVVINMSHPHVRDLRDRMSVLNHLKACIYEGIAQWKVQSTWGSENPSLMRAVKDSLLRLGRSIDES